MKVLYSWLKEYIDFELSPDELAERLTMAGLEVAGIERVGEETILELEVTPNRGDCLSMIGVAREVNALTGCLLRLPKLYPSESEEETKSLINISVKEERLCPRYTARIIKDIEVGPSPDWLKRRLSAVGIRPINNIVDITNYILLELGQPMHAFDYHLLQGNQLTIRLAKSGERLTTLDGIDRELNENILVIADRDHPVAIAGIMGGESTQVSPKTRDVLLEGAYFDPATIRRMSRSLGLTTESSYRFERGVDPEGLILAQERAAQLIKELAGGKIVCGLIDIYPEPVKRPTIILCKDRVNKILGTSLSLEEIVSILDRLGFKSRFQNSKSEIIVEVPSYRIEVAREIDLIEEIARIYGYEKIGLSLPNKTVLAPYRYIDRISKKTREILTGLGLYEIITFSLVELEIFRKLRLDPSKVVVISNPLSEETIMRTTLIPGLVKTVLRNVNRGMKDIKIFELGRVFWPKEDEVLPMEKYSLGIALMGHYLEPSWRRKDEGISFYELAGVVKGLFEGLGIMDYHIEKGEYPSLCPGRTAKIEVEGETLGIMGEMDPDVLLQFGLPPGLQICELEFDKIVAISNLNRNYRPLPKYPSVKRDLSILVKEETPAGDVFKIIKEIGAELIERVDLFDLYPAERLGQEYKGFKSLAYSIVYRSPETTLKDEFVKDLHTRIISELENRLGARLRG